MNNRPVYTYLISDGVNFKIGKSFSPKSRLYNIRTSNINATLICYGLGVSERTLHYMYSEKKVKGEWFNLNNTDVDNIKKLISKPFNKNDANYKKNNIEFDYKMFVENFKQNKFHKSYSLNSFDLYSYSSNKGKFGIANILIDVLVQDYSPIEIKLFFSIVNSLKQSTEFEESAILYLKYDLYSDICSHRVFYSAIKKYVSSKFIIPTPKNKYYIMNPRFVNKFYKTKIEK